MSAVSTLFWRRVSAGLRAKTGLYYAAERDVKITYIWVEPTVLLVFFALGEK